MRSKLGCGVQASVRGFVCASACRIRRPAGLGLGSAKLWGGPLRSGVGCLVWTGVCSCVVAKGVFEAERYPVARRNTPVGACLSSLTAATVPGAPPHCGLLIIFKDCPALLSGAPIWWWCRSARCTQQLTAPRSTCTAPSRPSSRRCPARKCAPQASSPALRAAPACFPSSLVMVVWPVPSAAASRLAQG